MQKWVFALPTTTEAEMKRKDVLQKELERTVSELSDTSGLGENGVRQCLKTTGLPRLVANIFKSSSSSATPTSLVATS